MSADTKRRLEFIILVAGFLLGTASAAKSYILSPIKIEQLEKKVGAMDVSYTSDHDLLIELRTEFRTTMTNQQVMLLDIKRELSRRERGAP